LAEQKAVLPPKMTFRQKALFGMGSAAFGVKDGGFNTFLLIFYSQIVGLPARWVGLAILIATVVDAVSDPFIGAVSDRWRSPNGRRHPSCSPRHTHRDSVLPSVESSGLVGASNVLLLLSISIMLRIAIACYEIPSAALIPELTRDYDERTSILAHRLFYQLVVPAGIYLIV
jgi:Na+/melibiose symporter-like transporter